MSMMLDDALARLKLSPAEEIVFYIIRHTNGDTKIFSRTYKQMQNDLGVSSSTITNVFKKLEANGTLIRAGFGAWYVPAVVGYKPKSEENWGIYAADD